MEINDHDFTLVMSLADILLCIPITSVRCETTFSHMKLIKTCRKKKMSAWVYTQQHALVKLHSDCVENFCPDDAVYICMNQSVQEKVQIVLDSEAVHEEELVEAEAEEETVSDDILAYKIVQIVLDSEAVHEEELVEAEAEEETLPPDPLTVPGKDHHFFHLLQEIILGTK
uniref:Uncharacterized protein LOC111116386 n=1 Tax=Crassostrea virginica TaxID=6565 RepID=A0A8B8C5U5_CRAVI|nr:uncharacterized protein LOC111116386 [Crassostrea virginica]